ncbi:MAG: hypothetical protein R6U96_01220 [Promethearchaeia archaeon]
MPYWRKKTLDYGAPKNWALPLFIILIAVQIITQWAGLQNIVYLESSNPWGVFPH